MSEFNKRSGHFDTAENEWRLQSLLGELKRFKWIDSLILNNDSLS